MASKMLCQGNVSEVEISTSSLLLWHFRRKCDRFTDEDFASLAEMVSHIYGRFDLLTKNDRPNMFMNEFKIYIDFLKKKITEALPAVAEKKAQYFRTFYENLQDGIEYYIILIRDSIQETEQYKEKMAKDLLSLKESLEKIFSNYSMAFCVS